MRITRELLRLAYQTELRPKIKQERESCLTLAYLTEPRPMDRTVTR